MAERRNWTWEETLIAFRLYCYTRFGKLHQHNPDIVELAERLGRTPSAVGMKACNFASLDPMHQSRGVVGLKNRGQLEEQVWERFQHDSEAVADEAEAAYEQLLSADGRTEKHEPQIPEGPTETIRSVKARRVQGFFRATVLTSYGNQCALTGLAMPALLNASHIIPWADSHEHRANPSNGICLNALHDRAFDRGLISFDDDMRLLISPSISNNASLGLLADTFKGMRGKQLNFPERFAPSLTAIQFHRQRKFQDA